MALNLSENPDWRAAVAKEREIRDAAYLGLSTPIAGGLLHLAPLTLRQQSVLFAARHPLVSGADCTVEDALVFLWVLEPDYSPGNVAGRNLFFEQLLARDVPWGRIVDGLRDFYVEQTIDSPVGGATRSVEGQAPAVCSAAVYVDLFAHAYGWSREYVLDSPLVCLNQERRCLELMTEARRAVVPVRGRQAPRPTGGRLSCGVEKAVVLERRGQRQEARANG